MTGQTVTAARFEAACAIAREAGALARTLFESRTAGTYSLKGHQDFLTEADGEVERLIAGRLEARFPEDAFYGEEHGGAFGARTWIVDPIDGTANFARGIAHFCVSIALVDEGTPTLGVIYHPVLDELFAARRDAGATLNGKPIRVSGATDIRQATIELGWSLRRPISAYAEMVARVLATGAGISRCGSGALGLAYVAAGRSDGYAELHINAWDVLAGILIVEEAGGWVNDFLANDGLRRGNPVLACTPALRPILLDAAGLGR